MSMKNQHGFVTTEFLFAIIIAFGMTLLTFSLTFTLSIVEITQYITYSSSRAHVAGNYDVTSQQKEAQARYTQLISNPYLKPLYTNGWFEISKPSDIEIRSGSISGGNFEKDYGSGAAGQAQSDRVKSQGVRTTLTAKILEMRLPFIGQVSPENDGFKTRINALMIREPSQDECLKYMESRREQLWTFDGQSRFTRFRKTATIPTPWEDNGC